MLLLFQVYLSTSGLPDMDVYHRWFQEHFLRYIQVGICDPSPRHVLLLYEGAASGLYLKKLSSGSYVVLFPLTPSASDFLKELQYHFNNAIDKESPNASANHLCKTLCMSYLENFSYSSLVKTFFDLEICPLPQQAMLEAVRTVESSISNQNEHCTLTSNDDTINAKTASAEEKCKKIKTNVTRQIDKTNDGDDGKDSGEQQYKNRRSKEKAQKVMHNILSEKQNSSTSASHMTPGKCNKSSIDDSSMVKKKKTDHAYLANSTAMAEFKQIHHRIQTGSTIIQIPESITEIPNNMRQSNTRPLEDSHCISPQKTGQYSLLQKEPNYKNYVREYHVDIPLALRATPESLSLQEIPGIVLQPMRSSNFLNHAYRMSNSKSETCIPNSFLSVPEISNSVSIPMKNCIYNPIHSFRNELKSNHEKYSTGFTVPTQSAASSTITSISVPFDSNDIMTTINNEIVITSEIDSRVISTSDSLSIHQPCIESHHQTSPTIQSSHSRPIMQNIDSLVSEPLHIPSSEMDLFGMSFTGF